MPWTPLTLNPVLWLPTAYLRGMTVERSQVYTTFTYATPGSLVGRIEDPASASRIGAGADSGRFTCSAAPSGGQNAFLTGSSTSLWVANATAKLLAFFNRNRHGEAWVTVRFAGPHGGTNNTIFDCCNSSGGQIGPTMRRQSDHKIYWQVGQGGGSICNLASAQTVNAAGDSAWYKIRARLDSVAGRAYLGINSNALVNATFTAAAVAADCSSDLYIGMRNSSSQPMLGDWADLVFFDNPQSDDAWSNYLAFNPLQTMDNLFRELVSHPTSLRPNQVTHLFDWFSTHLFPESVWKDTGRAANATATDDAVMLIDNLKPGKPTGCSFNRDATQSTSGKAPKWREGEGEFALDSPYWDGAAVNPPTVDLTGERDLNIAQQPEQSWVQFELLQQLRANDGSHSCSAGGLYEALGGSGHTDPLRRGVIVTHLLSTSGGNTAAVSGVTPRGAQALNIAITRKIGNLVEQWYSGNPNEIEKITNAGNFQPTHWGRPAIVGWDFYGYMPERFRIAGEVPASTIAKLYQGIIDAHNLTGFPPLPSGFLDDGPNMQTIPIKPGSTSQSKKIFIRHSATKEGLTGLAHNTPGLTCYTHRHGGTSTVSALASLAAVDSAWTSGGFKEIDAVNQKGWYRWDVPNALAVAVANSEETTALFRGATDMEDTPVRLTLAPNDSSDVLAALATVDGKLGSPSPSTLTELVNDTKTFAQGTAQAVSSSGVVLAASERVYHAAIDLTRDAANARDEWTVRYFRDMIRQTSGVTSPTIQIIKRADGTDLVAETPLVQIGATGAYKLDVSGAGRLTVGEAALVVVRATIDAATRTYEKIFNPAT